jgi:hypothetical protein
MTSQTPPGTGRLPAAQSGMFTCFDLLYLLTWGCCVLAGVVVGARLFGTLGGLAGLLAGLVVGWAARYGVALVLGVIVKLLFGGRLW